MTFNKYLFGALAFVFLMASVFAAEQQMLNTMLVVQPADAAGSAVVGAVVNVSIFVFEPGVSSSGTTVQAIMKEISDQCQAESPTDVQTCIEQKSAERFAGSTAYELNRTSLQDAHIRFEYYNPIANSWSVVEDCADLKTDQASTYYKLSPETGEMEPATNWYTQCTIPESVYSQRAKTQIRVIFEPLEGQQVNDKDLAMASYSYDINTAKVNPLAGFAAMLNDIVKGVAEGGPETGPQCVGVFLILGLLLASMYFTGKSPITLLDITTPRLPAPKGVAASGQVLAPFGYAEMKRTTQAKMAAAAGAIGASIDAINKRRGADPELNRYNAIISSTKGTAADRLAAAGNTEENQRVARGLVAAGRMLGMSSADLERLARTLPYHYGAAEHKIVAQILQGLESRGGRDALLAMTMKDYMLGLRTYQSLETLTAHPDLGQRSAAHYALTKYVGKAFGPNRYAVLGGALMPAIDSTFRSGRMVGRMTKAIVTEAAPTARAVTKTTMEMIGGKRSMERLEAAAKRSDTAAWAYKELQKHPSQVMVGTMYPATDKMGHLYKTLNGEARHDQMGYVMAQIYKKMGITFNLDEKELAKMGHTDVDILKRCGYKPSAELAEVEAQMRKILTTSSMDSQAKLRALTDLAQAHGATVDRHVMALSQKLDHIEHSAQPDYVKQLMLLQVLQEENNLRNAARAGSRVGDDAYLCLVGGDSLRGNEIWKKMVTRTMMWDGENGYLKGGIKEELISAKLNTANRLATLDPSTGMEQLPEHMRDASQLKKVAERNRSDMISLFTDEGKAMFQQSKGKSINSASIHEIVDFMYGGNTPKSGHIDPATGKMVWWGANTELSLPQRATLVDVKRHWITSIDSRENIALGQWAESRHTKSYVPHYDPELEARANRMPGSASWSVEERTKVIKSLHVEKLLAQDMEQRFNSHFAQNAYGTTHETSRFYGGVVAGFLGKVMQEKGMEYNHPEMRFLEQMDLTNAKHLSRLTKMLGANRQEFEEITRRPVSYDDIAKTNKAMVMLHEGGFAYYHKGMMLGDMDRIISGSVAIRDEKGQVRKFVPEEVQVKFGGRADLEREYHRLQETHNKNPEDWKNFVNGTMKWAKEGGYNFEREQILAAVLWSYGNTTYDYSRFWKDSAVSVEAKRSVAPVAPSILTHFGADGNKMSTMMKPYRDIALLGGDYISKVALAAGGPVLRTSHDITPVSEYYRQHSWQLSSRIMSGEALKGLSAEEQVAYRRMALEHGAYHQVWDFAIDRHPAGTSTSFGAHQSWNAFFHFGPAQNYSIKDNLRAYMGKGEYANFVTMYGWPMDLAGKMMRPYTSMIRGVQMSMQGYASKWDSTPDALRQWNYTPQRLMEAMQSVNPFASKMFHGKNAERLNKLNVFGGSLERHQLAGADFLQGLAQAPQDIYLSRKGVYATARTDEANPGTSAYDYRHTLRQEAKGAEYMLRAGEAAYLYDQNVIKAANDNTVRRTVSAEVLAMRREQELSGFRLGQNPIAGFMSPALFAYHFPAPGMPQSLAPKNLLTGYLKRSKTGEGGDFGGGVRRTAESMGQGASKMMQPWNLARVVYCPRCGMANLRGSVCKNASCRQVQY